MEFGILFFGIFKSIIDNLQQIISILWIKRKQVTLLRLQKIESVRSHFFIQCTIREVVGDTNLSDKWFEGQLHLAASKDPRLTEAFQNRETNPSKWGSIVKAIGQELKSELAPVDAAATESWNAVEASVRSASTSTPKEAPAVDAKALKKMSDADFEAYRKEMGFKR